MDEDIKKLLKNKKNNDDGKPVQTKQNANKLLKEVKMPSASKFRHTDKHIEQLKKQQQHQIHIKQHHIGQEPTSHANYNHYQGPQL